MRKLVAILMLSIFTFNIGGYRLIFEYIETVSDIAMEEKLDKKQYKDSELVSIKQPVQLPYYTNNENYQRIDGEIEINGITYKYVKSRIYNDSLEMLCIPDNIKMAIEKDMNAYAKVAHGFSHDNSKKDSNSPIKYSKKMLDDLQQCESSGYSISKLVYKSSYVLVKSVPYLFSYTRFLEHPPDNLT